MFENEYTRRAITQETNKAYLVEQVVNNPRDGYHTKFKWVAKSQCKNLETLEVCGITLKWVYVPNSLVSNGV